MGRKLVESSLWLLWRTIVAPWKTKRSQSMRSRSRLHQPPGKRASQGKKHRYIKGVYSGNFYRVKVANVPKEKFDVPRLISHPMPKPFKPVPASPATIESTKSGSSMVSSTAQQQAQQQTKKEAFQSRIAAWWKQNWPILVLNAGSLCTLIGFTRSDVLELRTLSTMGSLSFICYASFVTPDKWIPIAWNALFASVNQARIFGILNERRGRVVLSDQQQAVYEEFFLLHGMTPKQFEMAWNSAKKIRVKKGSVLIKKGEPLYKVWLVLEGMTRANVLGRHLSAASSGPGKRKKHGGDSGAWIGEMVFLQTYGGNQAHGGSGSAAEPFVPDEVKNDKSRRPTKDEYVPLSLERRETENKNMQTASGFKNEAFFTIMAAQDSVLLEWTHEEMATLMERSPDMRSALTRAMTAAIVGKVINFTVSTGGTSENEHNQRWTSWLSDWKQNSVTTAIQSSSNNNSNNSKKKRKLGKDCKDEDDEDDQPNRVGDASSPLRQLAG